MVGRGETSGGERPTIKNQTGCWAQLVQAVKDKLTFSSEGEREKYRALKLEICFQTPLEELTATSMLHNNGEIETWTKTKGKLAKSRHTHYYFNQNMTLTTGHLHLVTSQEEFTKLQFVLCFNKY